MISINLVEVFLPVRNTAKKENSGIVSFVFYFNIYPLDTQERVGGAQVITVIYFQKWPDIAVRMKYYIWFLIDL